jgi:hypothetical protein
MNCLNYSCIHAKFWQSQVKFDVGAFGNIVTAAEKFRKFFVTVQEHFEAYCRYREVVKLFRFLM